MRDAIVNYFRTLSREFGGGWNRFWYRPSDPITLGVLRIFTGLYASYWVATYAFDLLRFFGPDGVLPVALIDRLQRVALPPGETYYAFSYLNYLHTPAQLWAAHLLGVAVLLCFTLGLFTRITSILALAVVLSYIHRAPILTGQVEPILAFLLFYLCLGPAGACLSLDARRKSTAGKSFHADGNGRGYSFPATISLRLVQVHTSVVYVMMAIGKLAGPEGENTWWLGDAAWWIMARPGTRLVDLTPLLAEHVYLVDAWTHAIVLFELAFGLLIWNRLARPLLLVWAVAMWLSLALISGMTGFCLMMLVANLAFVPAETYRAVISRTRSRKREPAQEQVPASAAS